MMCHDRLRRPPGSRFRRRHLAILVCAAAVPTAGACFNKWGKDLGGGAVDAVRDRSPELLVPLRDSIVAIAGRTYEDSLRPRLESTVDGVLDTIESRAARLEDTLAVYVEGRLNEALRTLLDSNMSALRDSGRSSVAIWSAELSRSVRRDLLPVVGDAADAAAGRALDRLNASLSGPLRETILQLVAEAAGSLKEKAGEAVEEQRGFLESLFEKIGLVGGLLVGGLLLLLVGALVVVFINARNSRRALQAVTAVVRDRGSGDLRDAIRDEASGRGVERWLNKYLSKQNLLWRENRSGR